MVTSFLEGVFIRHFEMLFAGKAVFVLSTNSSLAAHSLFAFSMIRLYGELLGKGNIIYILQSPIYIAAESRNCMYADLLPVCLIHGSQYCIYSWNPPPTADHMLRCLPHLVQPLPASPT